MGSNQASRSRALGSAAGFSLPELLIAVAVMLIISGTATTAIMQMSHSQKNIWNRTEMHSGVRAATELLQQEIGQAGRIALPGGRMLQSAVATGSQTATPIPTTGAATATLAGIFVGEKLTIGAGASEETVTVTAVNTGTNTFTATFTIAHTANEPIRALGGFQYGIVPTDATNGSTATTLKMFGDINGDGSMVYVEYTCDTTIQKFYRNSMAYDTAVASKPTLAESLVLISNITANPGGAACFIYDQKTVNVTVGAVTTAYTFVLDVAIMLTVETQNEDSITNEKQTETKALLNVSPRNVFNVWQLASANSVDRMQATPATVTALLP